jgi:methionine synthase II (cobalamin-independent)
MKRSTDRILTTHTGSLPRPDDLIAMMRENVQIGTDCGFASRRLWRSGS